MLTAVLADQRQALRNALVAAVDTQNTLSALKLDAGPTEALASTLGEVLAHIRSAELSAEEALEVHRAARPAAVATPPATAAPTVDAARHIIDFTNATRRAVARLVSELDASWALSSERSHDYATPEIRDEERHAYIALGIEALGYLEALEIEVRP